MKQILTVSLLFLFITCKSQKTVLFNDANLPKLEMNDSSVLNWNKSQVLNVELSNEEQEFYYWVNYSRLYPVQFFDKAVIPIINVYPQLKGENLLSLQADMKNSPSLPLLSLHSGLLKMAVYHAKGITETNSTPSHMSADGETFAERFKKFGLKDCGSENISFSGGSVNPLFMLVLLYLDINVTDLGHRKTLLNPSYLNTGIAISTYKNGNAFLVEDFACNQK